MYARHQFAGQHPPTLATHLLHLLSKVRFRPKPIVPQAQSELCWGAVAGLLTYPSAFSRLLRAGGPNGMMRKASAGITAAGTVPDSHRVPYSTLNEQVLVSRPLSDCGNTIASANLVIYSESPKKRCYQQVFNTYQHPV